MLNVSLSLLKKRLATLRHTKILIVEYVIAVKV